MRAAFWLRVRWSRFRTTKKSLKYIWGADVLQVSGVNQYYGGRHILWDASFGVPIGACTVLLGRNGVGKTTLLKSIMGAIPIRGGTVKMGNKDVASLPPYARAALGM